ncbi:MAG: hypothetical protein ACKOU6_02830, partial [Planctomycetota bacterium]
HEIDVDELHQLLPEPEFHEALGVLEMITHTPETRELYEARLKAQLDEEARLYDARTEGLTQGLMQGRNEGRAEGLTQGLTLGLTQGLTQGRVEGKLIGKIQVLEGLLGVTHTDPSLLESWNEAQLEAKCKELEQQRSQSIVTVEPLTTVTHT